MTAVQHTTTRARHQFGVAAYRLTTLDNTENRVVPPSTAVTPSGDAVSMVVLPAARSSSMTSHRIAPGTGYEVVEVRSSAVKLRVGQIVALVAAGRRAVVRNESDQLRAPSRRVDVSRYGAELV